MKAHDNKALVVGYINAFNRGDLDGVCAQFAPDTLVYGVLGWGRLDKVRPIWEELVGCFRMHLHLEFMIEEGNVVAARYTESGVFREAFRGTEPTGKSYEVVALEWYDLKDGLILWRWGGRGTGRRSLGRLGSRWAEADWDRAVLVLWWAQPRVRPCRYWDHVRAVVANIS
jgi:hypothetical protein